VAKMKLNELKERISSINSEVDLKVLISRLKILSSNMRSKKEVINLIEEFIAKANQISDFESTVVLHGLLILQLEHKVSNFNRIISLLEEMQCLAHKINYKEGIAFSYSFSWYIEKFQGNIDKSREEINKAVKLLNEIQQPDEFIYCFINYSYALEEWLNNRNPNAIEILESCVDYFYKNYLYHSLAMSLGALTIIYQQTQNKERSMSQIKKIVINHDFLDNMPEEIKSIIHYFVGVSHKLNFNLKEAEEHLSKAQDILKPIYKISIYSGYYVTTLSHLAAIYALQGKLELAHSKMLEVEDLLKEDLAKQNMNRYNRKQIIHTFNLTKFYIQSRSQRFQIEDVKALILNTKKNLRKYYSNAIMLSEFLISTELKIEELIEIKNLHNSSTKRVNHIIDFLIEKLKIKKEHASDCQVLKYVNTLKRRPVEERMTNVEKAFADLLAAQEYYKISRFSDIYPLLKKYKKQLHRIEVLEIRIFMEAFIQVGAFKNGDPLGPALQYMAIKKCRQYGFSRLENKLLDYLQLQQKEITRTV
jgi:tetratricopeptide (TPR) repeat protein